jgi:hypothetical protein
MFSTKISKATVGIECNLFTYVLFDRAVSRLSESRSLRSSRMLRGIGWQPRNIPEERRPQSHDGGSLQPHTRKHVASKTSMITEGGI